MCNGIAVALKCQCRNRSPKRPRFLASDPSTSSTPSAPSKPPRTPKGKAKAKEAARTARTWDLSKLVEHIGAVLGSMSHDAKSAIWSENGQRHTYEIIYSYCLEKNFRLCVLLLRLYQADQELGIDDEARRNIARASVGKSGDGSGQL